MSYSATHNMCAVSQDPESEMMPTKNVDLLLLSSLEDTPTIVRNRFTDQDEMTGNEEPTKIYKKTTRFEMPLTFERAQAQHFAFLLGFGLGAHVKEQRTGHAIHTITPIDGEYSDKYPNPSFTLKMKTGDTIGLDTYSGVFVDEVTARFEKDAFASLRANLKGTGKVDNALIRKEAVINGNENMTIDLSSAPVLNGKAENIHKIEVYAGNAWRSVAISSISTNGATLIVHPRSEIQDSTDYTYRIYYLSHVIGEIGGTIPEEPLFETPLFVSDFTVRAGGYWTGLDLQGGHAIDADLSSLEYTLSNNLSFETGFNANGARYATRVFREGRTQTLKLDKTAKNLLLRAYHEYNDYLGMTITATGDEIPNTGGEKYKLEMIFPKVGFMNHSKSIKDKNNAESLELTVLKSELFPSVIVKVISKLHGA